MVLLVERKNGLEARRDPIARVLHLFNSQLQRLENLNKTEALHARVDLCYRKDAIAPAVYFMSIITSLPSILTW